MRRLPFLFVCALCVALPAQAQTWPTKPVRMIINVAPGAVVDVVARLISRHLSDTFGQQFVVESRSGGDGYIGNMAVASAKDGHTFLHSPGTMMVITPHIVQRTDFVPLEELVPVAPTVRVTFTLLTRPDFPAKDFAEFIAYARAHPGKVSFGSAGSGTGLHITGEMLKRATQTDMLHVPYRGAGPAMNELLGGHIDFMMDPGSGREHAKAGRLKMLATAGASRHPDFPDVPTFTELRVDVDSGPYFGLYAPKGTPRDVLVRMNAEVAKALQIPEIRQRLEPLGVESTQMTLDQYGDYVRAENQRYASLVRELGLDKKPQ